MGAGSQTSWFASCPTRGKGGIEPGCNGRTPRSGAKLTCTCEGCRCVDALPFQHERVIFLNVGKHDVAVQEIFLIQETKYRIEKNFMKLLIFIGNFFVLYKT